jgi:hypothetical protein
MAQPNVPVSKAVHIVQIYMHQVSKYCILLVVDLIGVGEEASDTVTKWPHTSK